MSQIRDIVDKLKEVNKKDNTSLSIVINELPSGQKSELLTLLTTIERQCEEKAERVRRDDKETKVASKAEEEGRFLGRLKAKLNETADRAEQVVLKCRFTNLRELLLGEITTGAAPVDLKAVYKKLDDFVTDLDTLKCLARYKQGRILQLIIQEEGLTIAVAARKLAIPPNFAERLFNFTSMGTRFPALLTTGYSFNTLLKYKKFLQTQAENDENFKALLEINPDIHFEDDHSGDDHSGDDHSGDKEDELLTAEEDMD